MSEIVGYVGMAMLALLAVGVLLLPFVISASQLGSSSKVRITWIAVGAPLYYGAWGIAGHFVDGAWAAESAAGTILGVLLFLLFSAVRSGSPLPSGSTS